MTPVVWDVIVCGAGVGGATAAYQLAKSGAKTLLLEKEKIPRYKACGGGVTIKAAQLLPFDFSPMIKDQIHQVMLTYKLSHTAHKSCAQPLAFMVNRKDFDAFLVEKATQAGCTVRDGEKVLNIIQNEQLISVQTKREILNGLVWIS